MSVKCQRYSVLNMCVLRDCLSSDRFRLHFMAIGSEFQSRSPITLKDWSPKLTSFVRGTSSIILCCWDERVRPVEHCLFNLFARYNGAVPSRHRNRCTRILNSIRHFTGSQCNSERIGGYMFTARCESDNSGRHVLDALKLIQVFKW